MGVRMDSKPLFPLSADAGGDRMISAMREMAARLNGIANPRWTL